MKKNRLAVLPFIFLPMLIFGQSDWQLRKEQNGIRIYPKDVAGSALTATRAETTFDAPVQNCISVLKDVDGFTRLFPSCTYTEKIAAKGDTVQTQYIRLDAPWPVTDRDYAFEYLFRKGAKRGSVHVITSCRPNAYPANPSMIRLDKGEGLWVFTPTAEGKTKLVYEFHGSPGGTVPAWLANSSVVDSPLEMLSNFQRLVKEDRHKGKMYGFIRQ
jgi:hypothetical protein